MSNKTLEEEFQKLQGHNKETFTMKVSNSSLSSTLSSIMHIPLTCQCNVHDPITSLSAVQTKTPWNNFLFTTKFQRLII